jgi:tetratricopeptide (TPR) repeat protein
MLFGNPIKKKRKKLFDAGRQFAQNGEYEKAVQSYTEAIALDPLTNNSNIWYNRANAKAKLKDDVGAIEDYTFCIDFSTTAGWDAYYNRANSKMNIQDITGAVEDYTQVITLNPKYGPAFTSRARCYAQLQKPHLVIYDYLKAIDLDMNALTINTMLGLADAYYQLRDFENAKIYYNLAYQIDKSLVIAKQRLDEID